MKYWIKGTLTGIFLWILLFFSLQFTCSNFYSVGPAYPDNQPICYFLVVSSGWIYGFIFLIIGAIIGLIIDKKKLINK